MGKVKYKTPEIIASFLGVFIYVFVEWLEKSGISNGFISGDIYNWVQFRVVIVTLVAAMYGPIAGIVCGVGGSMLINALFEYSISYPEVIVVGIFGLAVGIFFDKFKVLDGKFGRQEFLDFCAVNVAFAIFSGIMVLPLVMYLIENKAMADTIVIGCKSVTGNSVLSCIICGIVMAVVSIIIKNRRDVKTADEYI